MKLGVIGYGKRIHYVLETLLEQDPNCTIAAIADPDPERVKQRFPDAFAHSSHITWFKSAEEMLEKSPLDGVLIGTRCSLHTEMALKVLPTGIPLFLEKPVATTMEDLRRLREGDLTHSSEVVVSFPLRVTSIVELAKEILDSGKIGAVEHVQAYNNVSYGGIYYHNWYRDDEETGGLFLQKATHDLDYIHHLIGGRPVTVAAMTSKQIFKGDKPVGLTCDTCDENKTCAESTVYPEDKSAYLGTFCSFGKDTGNEDSGSALIRYDSGMHVSYSQNFFVRNDAAVRGARFMGYKGTLEFDFYKAELKVYMHHTPRVETYKVEPGNKHFGGDAALARNFIKIMEKKEQSISPLESGLLSALMCIKARDSAKEGVFQTIEW